MYQFSDLCMLYEKNIKNLYSKSFTLYRCNVNSDASFDKVEGSLLNIKFNSLICSFNEKTYQYATQFVHPDDRKTYTELLKSESLLLAYRNGMAINSINYREHLPDGETRWIHLSIEMIQCPDCDDDEVFMLFEKAD